MSHFAPQITLPLCLFVLFVLLLSGSTTEAKSRESYYAVLGLTINATPKEIKVAYFKLAKQHHPDKQSSSESNDIFLRVSRALAYDILSDPLKRERYNNLLSMGEVEYDESRFRDEDQKIREEEAARTRFRDPEKVYQEELREMEEAAAAARRAQLLYWGQIGLALLAGIVGGFVLLRRTAWYKRFMRHRSAMASQSKFAKSVGKQQEARRLANALGEDLEDSSDYDSEYSGESDEEESGEQPLMNRGEQFSAKDVKPGEELDKEALRALEQERMVARIKSDIAKRTARMQEIEREEEEAKRIEDERQREILLLRKQQREEFDKTQNDDAEAELLKEALQSKSVLPPFSVTCPCCKKKFKSAAQWRNHELSNAHKKAARAVPKSEKVLFESKMAEIETRVLEREAIEDQSKTEKNKKERASEETNPEGESEEEDDALPEVKADDNSYRATTRSDSPQSSSSSVTETKTNSSKNRKQKRVEQDQLEDDELARILLEEAANS